MKIHKTAIRELFAANDKVLDAEEVLAIGRIPGVIRTWLRVVGTDPGTSSLDLLLLADGAVADQARLTPEALRDDPSALVSTLRRWGPIDLIAGPSGYGLPLVRGDELTEEHVEQMSLVRPDERGADLGVIGFRSWVRALVASGLPVVFLPGGVHLPTIPPHRKVNTIDLGTADKLAVAALAACVRRRRARRAVWPRRRSRSSSSARLLGGAGRRGGSARRRLGRHARADRRPLGGLLGRRGRLLAVAALEGRPVPRRPARPRPRGPGGLPRVADQARRGPAGRHPLRPDLPLGRLGGPAPRSPRSATEALARFGAVAPLPSLPGAWVKHAAQGAALLADGLAGGRHADLVESFALARRRGPSGTASAPREVPDHCLTP